MIIANLAKNDVPVLSSAKPTAQPSLRPSRLGAINTK